MAPRSASKTPESSDKVGVICRALRRAIIEQALEPGAKLPEDSLGERFGVSRTIARHALGQLAAEGLVELRRNRIAVVATPSWQEARDAFDIRIELERLVVRQLAGKLTKAQIAELTAHVDAEDRARDGTDAVSIRLPTVIVRPGRPNRAASSFFSAIVREPLLGLPADLPVPDAFAAWLCSPRRAVDWLLHAAVMDTAPMGLDRSVNPPGISTTIAHLLQALDEVKPGASALIRRVEDKEIAAIVGLWPPVLDSMRAHTLGFASHEPVVEVLRAFIADDLAATRAERGLPPG